MTAVSVWGVFLRLITIVVDQICLEGIIDWLFETNDKLKSDDIIFLSPIKINDKHIIPIDIEVHLQH